MAAAMFVLAAAEAVAQAPAPADAAAIRGPSQATGKPAQWPVTLSNQATAAPVPAPPWSQQEVEAAQARCSVLLKNLAAAVTVPEAPLREGSECGAPAPMRLVSLGRSQVAFTPPPIVTCELIVALAEWLERDVQPAARKHLGAPIARIETMSSYSCRNAYGRTRGRVSEHGRANALDIASFVTARGQAALVTADWGPTARQIAAQAAADARAEQTGEAKQPVQAGVAPTSGQLSLPHQAPAAQKPPPAAAAMMPMDSRAGVVVGIPGITLGLPGAEQDRTPTFGWGAPSRLGGPKPKAAANPATPAAPAASSEGKTHFLRAVHAAACKRFNTALGPEADKTHANHFHVDMAERVKNTKVCD